MRAALAVLVTIATACGHGGGAPPVDEPPLPVTTLADAAVMPPADAAIDATPALADDTGSSVDAGGRAYPANRRIKGTITRSSGAYVEMTFERPVAKGWAGELWDDTRDKAVPDSSFVIMGVRPGPTDRAFGSTKLPRPLADYGAYTSVRVTAPDVGTSRPLRGGGRTGDGYRVTRLIKGTITEIEGDVVLMKFEQPVRRGWTGDLWDETRDRKVSGAHFVIAGVLSKPSDGTEASTRLPHALSSYGDFTTVRVKEQYDGK